MSDMVRAKAYFNGKKITLMGLGLLGRGVGDAKFLAECGAELVVTDLKTKEQLTDSLEQLKGFSNITLVLSEHRLEDFKDRDMVIKAAGVPLDSIYIKEARKNKVPVRMSSDLFAELSGVPIVGVTGTRGKSTVAQLISHILKTANKNVLLGGNVRGVSTLSLLNEVTPDSVAVLELDSWQLQGFAEARMSPQVSVFTTFMPDHMNYYNNDMEAYFADKAGIFINQKPEDVLILGEQVAPFVKEYGYQNKIQSRVEIVSAKLPKSWRLKIIGEHNVYNAALAAAAARALGIDEEQIKEGIETFDAVEGRLQFVHEVNGIKIYNDNNATTPEATIAALKSFTQPVVLITGGADKSLSLDDLVEEIKNKTQRVILLPGTGTERIKTLLADYTEAADMKEAVSKAMDAAKTGSIVLLSPAFASFGLFKNEYDRNDQFIAVVKNL